MIARGIVLMAVILGTSAAAVVSRAQAETEARAGEGREVFVARCSSCHSIDYVEMHARFGTRALWGAEVAKMRNAYKAPLSDEEAKAIVDYLVRVYGPASTPASAAR